MKPSVMVLQVSDKGLSYLEKLTQLKGLALQGTAVTSSSMPIVGRFTDLQALDIAKTTVDSKGTLAKIPKIASAPVG